MKTRKHLLALLPVLAIACGRDRAVESSERGIEARGLVRAVACDGDEGTLTLDAPTADEPLEVVLASDALVAGELVAAGCEGLGQTLGEEVEVGGRIASGGMVLASRVDPLG